MKKAIARWLTAVRAEKSKKDLLVYGLGLILILGFGFLILVRPQVLAAQNKPQPKPAVTKNTTSKPVTPTQPVAEAPPAPVPAQPKAQSPLSGPQNSGAGSTTPATSTVVTPPPVAPQNVATLIIDGLGTFQVTIKDGDTALDVLQNAASQNKFAIDTTQYSFGTMVNAISGTAGDATHFWSFYYNGQMAQVGAGDQKVSNNDVTEWKYEVATW